MFARRRRTPVRFAVWSPHPHLSGHQSLSHLDCGLHGTVSVFGGRKTFVFSAQRRDWPWRPPSLLFSGYRVCFPGLKWLGREIGLSSPCVVEIKNAWNFTHGRPYTDGWNWRPRRNFHSASLSSMGRSWLGFIVTTRDVLRLFRRGTLALADAVWSYTILTFYFDIGPRNCRPTEFRTPVRPYGRTAPSYTFTAPHSTAGTTTNLVFLRAGRAQYCNVQAWAAECPKIRRLVTGKDTHDFFLLAPRLTFYTKKKNLAI